MKIDELQMAEFEQTISQAQQETYRRDGQNQPLLGMVGRS
jgi:hypothetical protein